MSLQHTEIEIKLTMNEGEEHKERTCACANKEVLLFENKKFPLSVNGTFTKLMNDLKSTNIP